jgi:hypothetical protein
MMHYEALTKPGKDIIARVGAFEGFYLAGGTALALQIGHRLSVDFDLFSPEEISSTLLAKAKRIFQGNSVTASVNDPGELTVFVNGVKITFLCYPYPVVRDLISENGLSLLSIQEIAATKAYTIGRRGSYKDYVDLYVILRERYASLEDIISIAEQKYGADFNGRLFLEQLIYLENIQDTEILFLKGSMTKDQVAEYFDQEIRMVNFGQN